MTRARREVVSLDDTPYYHCISRCVRRAFLCGIDRYSNKDYSHRREWVRERLVELTAVFGVQVCAYAIMRNHYAAWNVRFRPTTADPASKPPGKGIG